MVFANFANKVLRTDESGVRVPDFEALSVTWGYIAKPSRIDHHLCTLMLSTAERNLKT